MAGRTRMQNCTREDAVSRLRQAEMFVEVAGLVLDDESEPTAPGVAASLAILAGVAASDAACCARIGQRPRGQDHKEAVAVLVRVEPGGAQMAKDLQRLLAQKDDAHYGLQLLRHGDAAKAVEWAKRLAAKARAVVES